MYNQPVSHYSEPQQMATQSPGRTATPVHSVVSEQCSFVAASLEALHGGLDKLFDRLSPVLGPELPCNPCDNAKDPALPPLAEDIRNIGRSISRANDLISRLHQRLAI
jgi:hypothetical protein